MQSLQVAAYSAPFGAIPPATRETPAEDDAVPGKSPIGHE